MADDSVDLETSHIYAALQILLTWRLQTLCGGDTSYLDWTEKKFPPVYKGLMETLPAWIQRGVERQVPVELFEAMTACVENAHKQAFLLWKLSQQGIAPAFPPNIGGGFVQ